MQAAGISIIAMAPLIVAAHGRSTVFNNYVRVAYAWLHGRMWIDYPGPWLDAVRYNDHWYGVDGPFPAVLMLPSVLMKGLQANQTAVCIVAAAICVGLAWVLLARIGVGATSRCWLILFFFAGTDLWWCGMLGDVWFMAHVVAVLFTLLALLECTGRGRGWLVGLFALCAFESRFTLALAVPLYGWLLHSSALEQGGPTRVVPQRRLAGFVGTLVCGAAVWVAYNELMWGRWNDIGHSLYFHQDAWGQKSGSPLSIVYLPYQFYSFFLQAPILVEWLQQARWPFFKVDIHGVALTFTSPALILGCFAKTPRSLVVALWVTAALVAVPSFLYYLNGWYQFGMRHALDFEPFLLLLMALACRSSVPRWGAALILWSAAMGAWGVWWWNTFMRTAN
ncbi:MAG: hypothetical protein DLM53_06555 [Candidatus Eremiobacter antarcticus]|nr:MAG: hypothetical protein DLM53_06555 [Candidatus Eremiobacter sp. RRmetagenome_bin22]